MRYCASLKTQMSSERTHSVSSWCDSVLLRLLAITFNDKSISESNIQYFTLLIIKPWKLELYYTPHCFSTNFGNKFLLLQKIRSQRYSVGYNLGIKFNIKMQHGKVLQRQILTNSNLFLTSLNFRLNNFTRWCPLLIFLGVKARVFVPWWNPNQMKSYSAVCTKRWLNWMLGIWSKLPRKRRNPRTRRQYH